MDAFQRQRYGRDKVVRLLRNIGKATLVGEGTGATIAWLAADMVPEFVHGVIAIGVVVYHGRQERHLDGKPPEEQGGRKFELFAHIPPLLGIVGKYTGDCADWPRE